MELGLNFFSFPFQGNQWQGRVAVGASLAIGGYLLVSYGVGLALWIPLMGYGLRIMRQTVQGIVPELPNWDDMGSLFRDGLYVLIVLFVYLLPMLIIACAGVALFAGTIVATVPQMGENPEVGISFVTAEMLMFVLFGLSTAIGLPMGLLGGIGLTRVAAHDRLGAAFELGEVWALARRGHGRFLLSFAMLFGLYFLGMLIAQVTIYTIILCVLYPVLLGLLMFYLFAVGGALFGAAYHDTQSAPDAPALPSEAAAAS